MRFTRALRLEPGKTLALVGAGGKSAILGCLAGEAQPDLRVILTTTTHLGLDQSDLAESHIVLTDEDGWQAVASKLERHTSVLVTGPQMATEPRWTSPGDTQLIHLQELAQRVAAVLLIEADGARRKPFKAPAEHEPIVPDFTNTLVPVVGASVFGRPLGEAWVHRPERIAALLGIQLGERLTPDRVAKLIGASKGGLKGRPQAAEVRVVVNQVDGPERLQPARECAQRLLTNDSVGAVLLGSAGQEGAVHEVRSRTAGVILAAGGSERMGRPKLLETWKSEPLIRHVVRGAVEAGLSPIVVVLGDAASALAQVVEDLPVSIEVNAHWKAGQSTSLQVGLGAVRARCEAAVFLLGDMPLVKPGLIRSLIDRHATSLSPIIAPVADGRQGNPVLFDRATFDALDQVRGDQGGRAIFDQFEMETVEGDVQDFFDLDTQADLDWLLSQS